MQTITIDFIKQYEGMDKQLDFIMNDSFLSAFFGGIGNGKSQALVNRAILISLKYPGVPGLIGRATYPELRDSTIKSFFDTCPPEIIASYNKSENLLTFKNGSTIVFRAFDDPRKILSMNLGWAAIDQLEEVSEELFLHILGRLRDVRCRFFFGVGNPEPGWVKRRFKDQAGLDKDLFYVEAGTDSNPHLPPDYLENLIKNFPAFWVKRYVHGDWNFFEGQVFSEFLESKNVIDPFTIPDTWKHIYVIDYGFRNPTACLDIAISHDDDYYVVNEHYQPEWIISQHAEAMKAMGIVKQSFVLIDPSCSAKNREKDNVQVSIIDEYNDCGIWPIPANNDIAGTLRCNQWFKTSQLRVFRNCFNTVREVSELRWKKVKPDYNKNLPEEEEDKNNHTTDCLRYFANSRTSAPKPPLHPNWYSEKRFKMLTSNKPKGDFID